MLTASYNNMETGLETNERQTEKKRKKNVVAAENMNHTRYDNRSDAYYCLSHRADRRAHKTKKPRITSLFP